MWEVLLSQKKQVEKSHFCQTNRRYNSKLMTTADQANATSKRSKWTEDELIDLPVDEHDYFERKSGQLLEKNKGSFLDTIAKAISAFANTGGGHLILGVEDNGSFDGLPSTIGKTSIKDWLEQKIP